MENFGRPSSSAFGEFQQNANVETCEDVYQSIGYDSGICLSNYRSTDEDSEVPRDPDSLPHHQLRDGDGPGVETDPSVQPFRGCLAPFQSDSIVAIGDVKDIQSGYCFEDQFYTQDEDGDTLLHLAIIKPDVSVAIRMIEMARTSEFLDIQNKTYMHTPLHLAVITRQLPVIRALIISGASVTTRDRHGNTALHLASRRGDVECVKQLTTPFSEAENRYLWNRGTPPRVTWPMQPSDINLINYEGESSLHLALFSAAKAGFEVFDHLVSQCSADINTKDGKCGYTVLHQAVKLKDVEIVQFLLRYPQLGINELCYTGQTALDIAVSLRLSRLEMVLRMAGGICTEPSDSTDISDDNWVDEFDDLMIGGLRINA